MRISNHFRLNKGQAELDFVDIDVSQDTRLFVDPYAIEIRNDPFSDRLKRHLTTYFQALLDAIRKNDRQRIIALTAHLSEPEDTFLGVSSGAPQGRGIGRGQADQIVSALRASRAVQTGLLRDMAETELFIEGISSDKLSDLTTNVIRRPLCEYTLDQCRLLGLETRNVAAGSAWNPETKRWEAFYAEMPIVGGRRVLLVPKILVRRRLSLNSQEFYNAHMLEFHKAEELRADSALVRILKKSKEKRVYKTDLKKKYPFSKSGLADFVQKHPGIIEHYKNIKGAEGPLENVDLEEGFDEVSFAHAMAAALADIPPGDDDATRYHTFMIGAITFLFYPYLTSPRKEAEIHEGRKRIDIEYVNSAKSGFFGRMRSWASTRAAYVFVECKNYGREVGNPELDQLTGRFGRQRGQLGIITCRTLKNRDRFLKRCRDTAQDGRGLVLVLTDEDVMRLLELVVSRQRRGIDAFLEGEARLRLS